MISIERMVSLVSNSMEKNTNTWSESKVQKKFRNKEFLKIFFGLSFLKSDENEDYFTDDIVAILPEDEKVQQFSDNILNNT